MRRMNRRSFFQSLAAAALGGAAHCYAPTVLAAVAPVAIEAEQSHARSTPSEKTSEGLGVRGVAYACVDKGDLVYFDDDGLLRKWPPATRPAAAPTTPR